MSDLPMLLDNAFAYRCLVRRLVRAPDTYGFVGFFTHKLALRVCSDEAREMSGTNF